MSADPLGASRARAARPGGELALGEVVTAVEYDIVGQRDGRFAQVRSAVATIDLARTDVNTFAHVNREITRHVIARTTTTIEALSDHLLPPALGGDVGGTDRAVVAPGP